MSTPWAEVTRRTHYYRSRRQRRKKSSKSITTTGRDRSRYQTTMGRAPSGASARARETHGCGAPCCLPLTSTCRPEPGTTTSGEPGAPEYCWPRRASGQPAWTNAAAHSRSRRLPFSRSWSPIIDHRPIVRHRQRLADRRRTPRSTRSTPDEPPSVWPNASIEGQRAFRLRRLRQ